MFTTKSLFTTALLFSTAFISSTLASPNPLPLPQQSTSEQSSEYTDDTKFRERILSVTNTFRKQHNATSLKWNDTLASGAKTWSERCEFEHSGGPSGENLSSGYPNATASVLVWGNERTKFSFKKPDFSTATGHFTQLVWKSTTTVGCGRTECNGGQPGGKGNAPGWYVVCEYWPAGNVIGQFQENVQSAVKPSEQPQGPNDSAVPVEGGVERFGVGKVWILGAAVWVAMWML